MNVAVITNGNGSFLAVIAVPDGISMAKLVKSYCKEHSGALPEHIEQPEFIEWLVTQGCTVLPHVEVYSVYDTRRGNHGVLVGGEYVSFAEANSKIVSDGEQ